MRLKYEARISGDDWLVTGPSHPVGIDRGEIMGKKEGGGCIETMQKGKPSLFVCFVCFKILSYFLSSKFLELRALRTVKLIFTSLRVSYILLALMMS